MGYGELWRQVGNRGWKLTVKAAFFEGLTTGVEIILDAGGPERRGTVVHHADLADDEAVLNEALRLCREVCPEFW